MASSAHARILAVNRGSATLKAALYACDDTANPQLILSAQTTRKDSRVHVKIADAKKNSLFEGEAPDSDDVSFVLDWLAQKNYLADLVAIGHRIVHGGTQFIQPSVIDSQVLAALEKLVPLDPDHLRAAIDGIRAIQQKFPQLPQLACFDTAFHATLPKVATMYAVPRALYDDGIRRFGFHGLSYEYILRELQSISRQQSSAVGSRVIVAHLGSGASVCAIKDGRSLDTSMGFTALEGLVMGTRSGDLDPSILIYLLRNHSHTESAAPAKMSPDDLDHLLNKKSGLLGVSAITDDMRELIEKSATDTRAAEAVDLFCYRVKKYIGAYAAALGGLETLVFTAGIGERSAPVREKICAGLDFLGIALDPQRNQANEAVISTSASRVTVRVIPTNEELTIVRHVLALTNSATVLSPAR
jgi:acetate kinase